MTYRLMGAGSKRGLGAKLQAPVVKVTNIIMPEALATRQKRSKV